MSHETHPITAEPACVCRETVDGTTHALVTPAACPVHHGHLSVLDLPEYTIKTILVITDFREGQPESLPLDEDEVLEEID